jgi:hypothetical protein
MARSFSTSWLLRILLLLIFCLGFPCPSPAQANQSSWSSLSPLQPGQIILVVETNGKKHSGTFLTVSDAAIAYKESGGEQSVPKQEVRSVKLTGSKSRMRHILIGTAIGAGAGAGGTAAAWESHGFLGNKGAGAAVGAVIGGFIGAVAGALMPSHSTIYNVGSH